jgi:Domain of unknown function (DUF2017)
VTGTGPGDFPAENGDSADRDFFAAHGETGAYGDVPGQPFEDETGDDRDLVALFRPVPGGAACFFGPSQAAVIRTLVGHVADLIRSEGESAEASKGGPPDELEMLLGLSGNDELPEDPVLARLLPDAYKDDPEAAAEFRRYTEESLRSAKISSAQAVLAALPADGGEVVLSEPECQQWLRALNDVRLAIGTRLGITEDNQDLMENFSLEEPRSAYLLAYQWLSELQDSLINALA